MKGEIHFLLKKYLLNSFEKDSKFVLRNNQMNCNPRYYKGGKIIITNYTAVI